MASLFIPIPLSETVMVRASSFQETVILKSSLDTGRFSVMAL